MSTIAVVQARMTSSRLPGKVALPLAGRPLLVRLLERARRIPGIDAVCVAVPEGSAHDAIAELVAELPDIGLWRGSERDVLARVFGAAEHMGARTVVRITGDCPLLDPAIAGLVVAMQRETSAALAATALEHGYPIGLDVEAVAMGALREAHREATDPYEREHVTAFLWRRPERYPAVYLDRVPDTRALRLAVDTAEDYALVSAIYEALHDACPDFGLREVEHLLARRPELLTLNRHIAQRPYRLGEPRAHGS